ncbi:hypothetical protein KAR91_44405 [Candidatus Pacearchaeota archaeon]|nr:hypothetical protein [Candidatus Pacearchaeota archaeon]
MTEKINILNCGGGVNTGGLLAMACNGELEIDYIIFADTGVEWPETYLWIDKIAKPTAKEIGAEFITVKGSAQSFDNLYDFSWHYEMFPIRMNRWCTDKFKARPIHKWIKDKLLNEWPEDTEINQMIGIDAGEAHRAKEGKVFPITYPLVERGITRKGCKKLIKDQGWPIPIKSGCYLCPFARVGQLKILFQTHPELFEKAQALEEHASRYPEFTISRYSLKEIKARINDNTIQTALDGYEEPCLMCHL